MRYVSVATIRRMRDWALLTLVLWLAFGCSAGQAAPSPAVPTVAACAQLPEFQQLNASYWRMRAAEEKAGR